jgi:hypothetical protein
MTGSFMGRHYSRVEAMWINGFGRPLHIHAPALNQASIGPITTDYPDLILAAVLGSSLGGGRLQRRAAGSGGAGLILVELAQHRVGVLTQERRRCRRPQRRP